MYIKLHKIRKKYAKNVHKNVLKMQKTTKNSY
jgi:hypothetical protein